ncbi:flagellar protein FlaG [Helicobacter kayseriensis]|uniref:flagellar protein FlaG n=1 Tax=Helicobacter kayseriensis TaxID=2905877 RepID=UPI001E37CF41|nr:flagellar protein FlaG [Helicobacter kayseriensis]MCE3047580.1 flagellar protein FlaG [Helicobacter kayseriensis]MCE3048951.1 flagellar protein FlaG [Helicobacter kayseriensis]
MLELRQNISLAQEKILDLAKQYGGTEIGSRQVLEKRHDTEEDKKLREELQSLTQKFNQEMRKLGTDISFNYDDTIEGLLVVVKDVESQKVIREIPSKEAIELMKKMHDLVGAIFNKQG